MKYIKEYSLYENNDYRVLEDLKDICLELEDIEFNIDIRDRKIKVDGVEISAKLLQINKPGAFIFEEDSVEDVVKRIVEYLGERFIYFTFVHKDVYPTLVKLSGKYYSLEDMYKDIKDKSAYTIDIYFKL